MKVPPQNLDAEVAVLGGILLDNSSMNKVLNEGLNENHFYREANGKIFEAMFSLHRYLGEPIDLITLSTELEGMGCLNKVGGPEFLGHLATQISTSAGVTHHAKIIITLAYRRRIINDCSNLIAQAYQPTMDTDMLLQEYRQAILDIQGEIQKGSQDNTDPLIAVTAAFDEVMRRHRDKNGTVGPLTGFTGIDQNLYGLEPGATYYIGAESTTGKTALALQIADQVTAEAGGHTLFYTLESTALEVNMRRLSRESGIPLTRIRLGNLRDIRDQERLHEAAGKLTKSSVRILDDSRYCEFGILQAHAETFAMEHKMTMIVVDFLQQMSMGKSFRTEHHMYKAIANSFNRLAKTLNIPVLILSQLNEDGQLKESRDIHNTAIHEWKLVRENQEAEDAKLIGIKAKNSGPWKTELRFDRYIQKFYDA